MRVELFFALRLLRDARTQALLIASGAAVGVAVIIFLTALIDGLQRDLIARTVGSQAHVSIEPAVERPRPLYRHEHDPQHVVISRVERSERRLRALDGARTLLERAAAVPGVRAAAEVCSGPATAQRGAGETNVQVTGLDPEQYTRVVDLRGRLLQGELQLKGAGAVVGVGVAETLGLAPGDRFRLRSGARQSRLVRLEGVLRYGVQRLDDTTVLVPLRSAQTLLGLPSGVTGIELAVDDIYDAELVADQLRRNTGLDVVSWMERNTELLTGLRSQSSSSTLIQLFVLLAVAIGVASVLAVWVVQRRREIGILRAMGLSRRRTQRVFLIQGGLLGAAGALLGAGLGTLLVLGFQSASSSDGMRSFPIDLEPSLFIMAGALSVATGVGAAVFPARRAAALDPAVAIRNE